MTNQVHPFLEKLASLGSMHMKALEQRAGVSAMHRRMAGGISGIQLPATAPRLGPGGVFTQPARVNTSLDRSPRIPSTQNMLKGQDAPAIKKPAAAAQAKNPLNSSLAPSVQAKPSGGPVLPGKNIGR
jgi:hypothetical protein